jgi:flagellar basal-body rod modification protein FlgD
MSASTLPIGTTLSSPAATAVTGSTGGSTAASAAGTVNGIPANMQISQAQFLQLISTQMQNQNPLNPTDPTQFLAQIEGLSEVSSLQSLQTSISGLTSGLQGAQLLNGTSLLGHSVLAPGSSANLAAGGSVAGAVSAPAGTNSLTVSVTDSSGALVDAFAVAPQSSGYTNFSWNGTTASGSAAPAGQYTLNVSASVGGASQSVSPLIYSQVQSVTIDPSSQTLELNTVNGTVPMSSVVNIQ